MAIYVFSLLTGYEMGGVDYAQAGRDNMLRASGQEIKYIFTEAPIEKYIKRYADLGVRREDMISPQIFLAGTENLAGECKVETLVRQYKEKYKDLTVEYQDTQINLFDKKGRIATLSLREDRETVCEVQHYNNERLLARDVYTDRRLWTEHYVTECDGGRCYAKHIRTTFVDASGNTVYDCVYDRDGREQYVFPDGRILTKEQMIQRFLTALHVEDNDIAIIDRPGSLPFVQPLFQMSNKPKMAVFLHSGHYFERAEDPSAIYLNYEYYYWFKYVDMIDCFIVSSKEQKRELQLKLKDYECSEAEIYVIPASGIRSLHYAKKDRKKYSLLTVSRLQERKRVDRVIRAVMSAHQRLPEVTLDIYGTGDPRYIQELKNIVEEGDAGSYIRFMGHCDVTEVYVKYDAYITASLWETLGLSLMEAAASGNAFIGLDVRYGNRMFIEKDGNGIRIPFSLEQLNRPETEEYVVNAMADAIVELFRDEDRLRRYQERSYEIAKEYLNSNLEKKWVEFVREILEQKKGEKEWSTILI